MAKQLLTVAAGFFALMSGVATAATTAVDLVFFIDYSGSNNTRRLNLAGQMQGFLDALLADGSIDTARIAIMGSERTQPILVQDLTSDASLLEAAIVANIDNGGSSLDEDPLDSILPALPNQGNVLGLSYDPDAIKSFVILTDEPEQSAGPISFYVPILEDSGFMFNMIVPYTEGGSASVIDTCVTDILGFPQTLRGDGRLRFVANPADGVFSICDFDDDPTAFFAGFAKAKIDEIEDAAGIAPVPLPGGLGLYAAGLLACGLIQRRRRKASRSAK